jgi:hypothetical protein
MIEILIYKIQEPFLAVSLRFATRWLCCNQNRDIWDESGIIRTQMRSTTDKKIVAVA